MELGLNSCFSAPEAHVASTQPYHVQHKVEEEAREMMGRALPQIKITVLILGRT